MRRQSATLRTELQEKVDGALLAVAGPVGLVIAVVFRWKSGLYALGHAGVRLALGIAGIRYRVTGREYVPAGAAVYCSNHQSNVDPPVLFEALHHRLHILYKAELHKFPIMGIVFDVGGFVPVDRRNLERSMASLDRGSRGCRPTVFSIWISFPLQTTSTRQIWRSSMMEKLFWSSSGKRTAPQRVN